ncbi:hypothetical protein NPIL_364671 [Nephila pilipes]|uniref:Uncharacterized protein n=1 Tax=Nephila pilipes TaxID=299642 RepID=A0A8X6PG40_NEPPI|nr:hypothetical protein NPIL_364671 [Nephila pilipes]
MVKLSKINIWKLRITWKLLKSAIFIACVACFTWQSVSFFEVYLTYPTVTSIDLTFPDEFIKPAVTLCNYNPVRREKFCAEYPHLCETPNNLTEFCKEHPYFCTHNVSNLVDVLHNTLGPLRLSMSPPYDAATTFQHTSIGLEP